MAKFIFIHSLFSVFLLAVSLLLSKATPLPLLGCQLSVSPAFVFCIILSLSSTTLLLLSVESFSIGIQIQFTLCTPSFWHLHPPSTEMALVEVSRDLPPWCHTHWALLYHCWTQLHLVQFLGFVSYLLWLYSSDFSFSLAAPPPSPLLSPLLWPTL